MEKGETTLRHAEKNNLTTATASDYLMLERYGASELARLGYFGVLIRLKRKEKHEHEQTHCTENKTVQ